MASARPVLPDRTIRDAGDVRMLFADLAGAPVERCGFAYLGPEWRLLGVRESAPGSSCGADVPLREVLGDVLRLASGAVVMVHNHPGGDPTPSPADIAVTRRLIAALEAIDVRLVDHVVLSPGGSASFREMGLL